MFGLYMLAIYLGVAVIAAGFVALLVVVALAVGLVTHPIRTLALVFHKLAALAAGLALILALIAWFWTDHAKPDFIPCFWGSIVMVVPEKLRTLDHGRPWSDDQFASTRLSSSRDMSR